MNRALVMAIDAKSGQQEFPSEISLLQEQRGEFVLPRRPLAGFFIENDHAHDRARAGVDPLGLLGSGIDPGSSFSHGGGPCVAGAFARRLQSFRPLRASVFRHRAAFGDVRSKSETVKNIRENELRVPSWNFRAPARRGPGVDLRPVAPLLHGPIGLSLDRRACR